MVEAAQAAGRVDVMICDELLNAVLFKIFTAADVLALMDQCRGRTELLLTGSAAPPELIDAADYATEFVEVKHPYSRGINARDGIEH
jgi:cob(I)alamin adenosyltransferase